MVLYKCFNTIYVSSIRLGYLTVTYCLNKPQQGTTFTRHISEDNRVLENLKFPLLHRHMNYLPDLEDSTNIRAAIIVVIA